MRLSIIIPVYNVEVYLVKCLDSVFAQNLSDFEVICVNDGSTDGSLKLLEGYESIHDNLRIVSQENKGAAAARNTGLNAAVGEYIFYLDGDDFLLDNASLNSVLQLCEKNTPDICICNSKIDGSRKYLEHFPENDQILSGKEMMSLFYKECRTIVTPFWMHLYNKKYLLEKKLYQTEGTYHEDELFAPIALYNAERSMCVDLPIVHYRWQREGAVTSKLTSKHYHDWINVGRTLFNYFDAKNVVENEPFRQVFSVFIGLAVQLITEKIPLQTYFSQNDSDMMRRCAITDYERKCYKLYRYCPSLLCQYRSNTIHPLLRKIINRFL